MSAYQCILPPPLFKKILHKKNLLAGYFKYLRFVEKQVNGVYRIKFLQSCIENDIIPNFLKFRVPQNGCFEPTIVHNFKKRLLRNELNEARKQKTSTDTELSKVRSSLLLQLPENLIPSVAFHVHLIHRDVGKVTGIRHKQKLSALSDQQERPLRNVKNVVRLLGDVSVPAPIMDFLSLGPKHPVRDKFKEMHFLADIDRILSSMKRSGVDANTLNEVNALTTWYLKEANKQPEDKTLKKVNCYLKKNSLKAVPFDKGQGFCVMHDAEYTRKLKEVLNCPQFQLLNVDNKHLLKTETKFNAALKKLKDRNKLPNTLYQHLRSTGAQPARLYGLAKVHKPGTPLRPVLSLPGSCYDRLNKWLSNLFVKVPGANIETSTVKMKDMVLEAHLEPDECIFSLDVKSLYTNVPVNEAIELACDALYTSGSTLAIDRSTCRALMKLAVTDVSFLCEGDWYQQKDGVAMGASLAVILANIWLKSFERSLSAQNPLPQDLDCCSKCGRNVTWQGYSIECQKCLHWVHRTCTDLSVSQLKSMVGREWDCGCNVQIAHAKVFGRYVDDILRSAKQDQIDNILYRVNQLHPNLEFTIERLSDGGIPFLDMYIKASDTGHETQWYQKATDTGLILSFHALAPATYKRNIIQGMIHRIFNATSTWKEFNHGLDEAIKMWEANQYPPQFYHPIVKSTIDKLIGEPAAHVAAVNKEKSRVNMFVMQYRGKISDRFSRKLRNVANLSVVFTTRKMKTALPSLKSSVDKGLWSKVVYQLFCSGCTSSYVGQTTRHFTTRLNEHNKPPSAFFEHTLECPGADGNMETKILDRCSDDVKLMTLEALYINRIKPALNRKEEYRMRPLTVKL